MAGARAAHVGCFPELFDPLHPVAHRRSWFLRLVLVLCMGASAFVSRLGAQETPPEGFIAIFNGHDLKGWRGGDTFDHAKLLAMTPLEREQQIERWNVELTPHWRVENGELVSSGVGRFLTTERDFGDFELRAEYRIERGGDTGIYLRGVPQVQLWDPDNAQLAAQGAAKGSGGLWNNRPESPGREPLVRADRFAGEWNAARVRMVGSRVSVWLNEQLVVDHAMLENFFAPGKPIVPRGPLQLQTHGGEVRWRRLYLREIAAAEANHLLAQRERAVGFERMWTRADAKGWAGATAAFESSGDAIRCAPNKSGTMYFAKELTDFVVRMEFAVLPGGMGGLALRYSGKGNPATQGLCRLQMLDEKFDERRGPTDPRQVHGSAYGLAAAMRGYQRPAGQWNFQEITVRGSTVRVELNGFVILDQDLSQAVPAPYLRAGSDPWRIPRRGFFGLIGEGAGVIVRALEYQSLRAFAE